MAKKIVEYEIPDNGDCNKCKHCLRNTFALKDGTSNSLCMVFMRYGVIDRKGCPACKDFLVTEASKVYCSDCVHLGDYPDWGCDKGQNLNNSINCKLKEQVC